MRGSIYQINAKPHTPGERGLPKQPLEEAHVTRRGLAGDFNQYRHEKKSDSPDMALLLIPRETLLELNREGWPIRPGDLGENVTTQGIPYPALSPGTTVRLGPHVTIQVSKRCDPCDNLYLLSYVGTSRGAEFLKTMVGRRGWYARVLTEGTIRKGDPVNVELRTPSASEAHG